MLQKELIDSWLKKWVDIFPFSFISGTNSSLLVFPGQCQRTKCETEMKKDPPPLLLTLLSGNQGWSSSSKLPQRE